MADEFDDNVVPFHSPKLDAAVHYYVNELYDLLRDVASDEDVGLTSGFLGAYRVGFISTIHCLRVMGDSAEHLVDILHGAYASDVEMFLPDHFLEVLEEEKHPSLEIVPEESDADGCGHPLTLHHGEFTYCGKTVVHEHLCQEHLDHLVDVLRKRRERLEASLAENKQDLERLERRIVDAVR